ncbi:MAG: CBS domain-containing protein [Candidatus Omnitrophica bacterium]|nr:CBS domain-containing protein [Candidatus Omnitrophota bacterium]
MLSIKRIMSTNVIAVKPDTSIYEALTLLAEKKVSGMPVVNAQNHVIGILSEKDVLKILLDKDLSIHKRVEDYMTRDVISFTEEDNATDICKFFIRSNIRRVPIVRNKELIGIVSRRDIVELILEAKSKISDFRFA